MKKWAVTLFDIVLMLLLLVGVSYRFRWVAWNQGTSLHPDEYGLTNTLTQLHIPKNLGEYFNTRLSPVSPYDKYDLNGQFAFNGPDNRMRWGQWPITFIRFIGEVSDQTGYDEIRLLGRTLSALADTLSVLLIFLIGQRLFYWRIGLLAAALSSLAVMQIQQSHFMTVDNFSTLFVMLGMYACVRIYQRPCASLPWVEQAQPQSKPPLVNAAQSAVVETHPIRRYQIDRQCWQWCLLFGVSLGIALACKVNLLPLGGMILIALALSIADLKLKYRSDLFRIFVIAFLHLIFAIMVVGITFRVAQPMTFRNATGDTSLWTLHLNPDWVESMKVAQMESKGIGGGPPGEQWAHRPAIIFPLVNIILWGMGPLLGISAWAGFLWAACKLIRPGVNRRAFLLPLIWTGGYFLFMGTRWVKSVRYFLPIYPFLCLFAAWGLWELWQLSRKRSRGFQIVAGTTMGLVLCGTFLWASAFTTAVYGVDHTRIQAAKWIFQNIPAPYHLALDSGYQPVGAPDGLQILPGIAYQNAFVALQSGQLNAVTIPHAAAEQPARLRVQIAADSNGQTVLAETVVDIPAGDGSARGTQATATFAGGALQQGQVYFLFAQVLDQQPVTLYRSVISNENWDEGLPMPFDNQDPFGQLYRGVEMQVRWYDDENKKAMFLDTLAVVDYLILPSQRGIWSTCRLPDMYPMTMAYYRALFDGSLGFDEVAAFQAPDRFGPLSISDVGGTLAWGHAPKLPLFNNNLSAAEEAFSVYDHPPVWIFEKRPDFSLQAVEAILGAIDLTKVQIQSPRDATGVPCRE